MELPDNNPETCPLCNISVEEMLYRDNFGFMVQRRVDGVRAPGEYMIVPHAHVGNDIDLPVMWQATRRGALMMVETLHPGSSRNISTNLGISAGQTLWHVHEKILLRDEPEGTPSFGWGLAALLNQLNQPLRLG